MIQSSPKAEVRGSNPFGRANNFPRSSNTLLRAYSERIDRRSSQLWG